MAGRPKKVIASTENTATVLKEEDGIKDVLVASEKPSSEVLELRKTLDQIGISYEESDSISQLALKLAKESRRINETTVSSAADLATKKFASYAPGTNLTDKDFLRRLFLMGVPGFYLKPHYSNKKPGAPIFLFNDMDHKLSDDRIWERIRFSGVTQKTMKETMAKYSAQPGSKRTLTPLV